MSDPEVSGVNKRISISLKAEGYADNTVEWLVPEELLRPYAIAYHAGIAALGLEISKAIYDKLLDSGIQNAETFVAKEMVQAASQ